MIGQASMKHKDPVCSMRLEEKDVQTIATYQARRIIFVQSHAKRNSSNHRKSTLGR